METNRLIGRIQSLYIDNYKTFFRIGFETLQSGLKPVLFTVNIKPFDQFVDREAKAHAVSVTTNLEAGWTFDKIADNHTKESTIGCLLHYIKNNLDDIIANKQPDKVVKLSTDPYRKIK